MNRVCIHGQSQDTGVSRVSGDEPLISIGLVSEDGCFPRERG